MVMLPHASPKTKITAADWWNPLVDAINANTAAIAAPSSSGGIADLATRIGNIDSRTTANGGISDIASRLGNIDGRTVAAGGISDLNTRMTAITGVATASGGISDIASRLAAITSNTTSNTTSITANASAITTLQGRATALEQPPFARYYQSTAQTGLADGAITAVTFDAHQDTDATVVQDAVNLNKFTLAAGVWRIDCGGRALSGTTAASTEFDLYLSSLPASTALRFAGDNEFVSLASRTFFKAFSVTRRFAANDTVALNMTIAGSGVWATNVSTEMTFISFTRIRL